MSEKKGVSNVVVVLIVVVCVVVAIVGVYAWQNYVSSVMKPKEVALSGTVTTTGTGTKPEKITFTSESNGNTYVADANSGTYSISLPNEDTYKVTITWKFLGITGGTADAGTLNLNSNTATMVKNWAG